MQKAKKRTLSKTRSITFKHQQKRSPKWLLINLNDASYRDGSPKSRDKSKREILKCIQKIKMNTHNPTEHPNTARGSNFHYKTAVRTTKNGDSVYVASLSLKCKAASKASTTTQEEAVETTPKGSSLNNCTDPCRIRKSNDLKRGEPLRSRRR